MCLRSSEDIGPEDHYCYNLELDMLFMMLRICCGAGQARASSQNREREIEYNGVRVVWR